MLDLQGLITGGVALSLLGSVLAWVRKDQKTSDKINGVESAVRNHIDLPGHPESMMKINILETNMQNMKNKVEETRTNTDKIYTKLEAIGKDLAVVKDRTEE